MAPVLGAGRRPTVKRSYNNKMAGEHRLAGSRERLRMAALYGPVRVIMVALAMQVAGAFLSPLDAQQTTQVNPQAGSIKEEQLLKERNLIKGRGTIPDTKSYVLEQPAGRDWRYFHQVTLRWIAGIAI